MDCFDMYDKYVKPEDDAQAAALAEQAKQEDNNLWDDNQPGTEKKEGIDQPKDVIEQKAVSSLSDADITAIAQKMVELMGQKGGKDGDEGTGRHDAE